MTIDFDNERFITYIREQGDREINHAGLGSFSRGKGSWCGCAIGEFLRSEIESDGGDTDALSSISYNAFAQNAEYSLPGHVFDALNESEPETFADVLDLDWDSVPNVDIDGWDEEEEEEESF